MKIFGAEQTAPLAGERPAVTLGAFDGVHKGHRAIIDVLLAYARKISAPALAITFEQHPRAALGRSAPPAICGLEARLRRLEEAGLDAAWVMPFTPAFSRLPARGFAKEFFRRRLAARAVALGETAVFGHGREGSAKTLAAWAADCDMEVIPVPPLPIHGAIASSTAIRLAVGAGNLALAAEFLGRPFSVEGTVVAGQGRGAKLGFPTLNLDPHHELRPPPGVYLTLAEINGESLPSLTNVGRPPTEMEIEAGVSDLLIETHLLDYQGDLYGRTAEIMFLRKMREVIRFSRESGLICRVREDLNEARKWFASRPEA
ncbi:MAG: riboflavin biosynthesis protein RibF [Planctomycetota bacterium]|jgi:riboflavin kinase/FMN adenylyltransferase|nr:riboflavin biosynthesis protein RibF [Planctomycetota bacterium]